GGAGCQRDAARRYRGARRLLRLPRLGRVVVAPAWSITGFAHAEQIAGQRALRAVLVGEGAQRRVDRAHTTPAAGSFAVVDETQLAPLWVAHAQRLAGAAAPDDQPRAAGGLDRIQPAVRIE